MSRGRLVLELPRGEKGLTLLTYAHRRGFENFLVGEALPEGTAVLGRVYRLDGDHVVLPDGAGRGVRASIAHPGDVATVATLLAKEPLVIIDFFGERVIPLENLLASRHGAGVLWVRADRPDQVPGLLGALEHGSDAVVLPVSKPEDVDRAEGYLDLPVTTLRWASVEVKRLAPGGSGERVIVDTTSMLTPQEGMLVGSQGGFLLHIVGETVGSRYTRPRPFRVNAGALHSYTLMGDGETRYLSELEAGDRVVIATPSKEPRTARVGRLKIERRPLALIEVIHERRTYTVFVQEAETVRLSGAEGPIAVTELAPGQRLWGVPLPPARHFGKAVEESILER